MYDLSYIKHRVANSVPNSVLDEFEPKLPTEMRNQSRNPNNWKVIIKEKFALVLDCKPFDDQLRCYVTLDSNQNMKSLEFSAE